MSKKKSVNKKAVNKKVATPRTPKQISGVIAIPKSILTDEELTKLEKIILGKSSLIKKALGCDELTINQNDNKYEFKWFDEFVKDEKLDVGARFIEKLCDAAKNQKKVTLKDKDEPNEKYSFRCFLLRLGYIGKDYSIDRKYLLKNFEGSSAFKDGKTKVGEIIETNESEVNENV